MSLIKLWEKTPDILLSYNIKQIVSSAGNGILKDKSTCANELKHFLKNAPSEKIFEHIEYCLSASFDKSGFVLQDLVNELGRRLDYDVEDGLYQGKKNEIGFDGLWKAPDGHNIIVEIKTTDAYRINLDVIAKYRNRLIEDETIDTNSSILIIVGRNDTGDLEAQIRGSRHAWDTRIISIEALIQLLKIKTKSDEEQTTEKIRNLLIPFEYTRLDNIIDVLFTTAKDVENADEEITEDSPKDESKSGSQNHTKQSIIEDIRQKALSALGMQEGKSLLVHKRTQFWDSEKKLRAVCPVSKLYETGFYWYAFHPHQKQFLSDGERGFLVLGCVDSEFAYAIPINIIEKLLPHLNMTENEIRSYWHIHLQPQKDGSYHLVVPKQDNLDLQAYRIKLA